MSKNNLSDLNNHLFMMLETLNDDELDNEQLEAQCKKAKAMCDVSRQIIGVANCQLSAIKTAESCGIINSDMPALVAVKDSIKLEVKK